MTKTVERLSHCVSQSVGGWLALTERRQLHRISVWDPQSLSAADQRKLQRKIATSQQDR